MTNQEKSSLDSAFILYTQKLDKALLEAENVKKKHNQSLSQLNQIEILLSHYNKDCTITQETISIFQLQTQYIFYKKIQEMLNVQKETCNQLMEKYDICKKEVIKMYQKKEALSMLINKKRLLFEKEELKREYKNIEDQLNTQRASVKKRKV